ncbi:MAG: hypothetical protein JWP69_1016 [Flaviaesturariibacter sp.]|nr:hypothetical protein [Flaviaesturariibacter sp.]
MKKLILIASLMFPALFSFAQKTNSKESRKIEKRQKYAAMAKQEEEGVLSYSRQNTFGIQLRTNGYGLFYEHGRMKTPRITNMYMVELTEIKHQKESRTQKQEGAFGGSYVYGKINNFYQFKLGFGQQYIFGQKGNKNGVAVMGIYQGGLSLGLLRPYYLDVNDNGTKRAVKYESADSLLFLGNEIYGSSGFSKGWNELKIRPGAFVKAALRFDFNKYNEKVQAVQIGLSVDAYAQEIPLIVERKPQRFFFQGHLAYIFGGRK